MEIDSELIEKIKNEGRAVINNLIDRDKLDFCKKIINKNRLKHFQNNFMDYCINSRKKHSKNFRIAVSHK